MGFWNYTAKLTCCFLFVHLVASSQVLKKNYCIWDDFSRTNNEQADTLDFQTYNPRIGINLIGMTDSVFSFIDGEISLLSNREGYVNVKIRANDNYFIGINLLKTATVTLHAKISKGQFIGLLNKSNNTTIYWINIYHDEVLLKAAESFKYLKQTCR